MSTLEKAITFECDGERLPAVIHTCDERSRFGVVFVVGGPQYRVGSHRQFVLMGRRFAAAGISSIRFDYRGMGDADGSKRSFDSVEDDIRAAIDCLQRVQPAIEHIVLLGLCDGASGAIICGACDDRVTMIVAMNPWVRSDRVRAGDARRQLRHYYWPRLLSSSFWRKLYRRELSWRRALRDLAGLYRASASQKEKPLSSDATTAGFVDRMLRVLLTESKPVLFILSENDLTAKEFIDLCGEKGSDWKRMIELPHIHVHTINGANHTFSARKHLDAACTEAIRWLESCV